MPHALGIGSHRRDHNPTRWRVKVMTIFGSRSAKRLGRTLIYSGAAIAMISILVAALACKPEVTPSPDLEGGKLKESVATQKRINRYFHSVVVPKLKTCWDRVQGKGTIEVKFWYENDAKDGWAFKTLEVGKSDLSEAQIATALACMQNAVTATSFPREASDTGESYLIDWVWPVPLPPDTEQQAARMLGSNGGEGTGCDGHGAAAKCMTCSGFPTECLTVCVGEEPPCTIRQYPGGTKTCSASGKKCASGGLFGVVGGVIMY
jgi:hypothetical protein